MKRKIIYLLTTVLFCNALFACGGSSIEYSAGSNSYYEEGAVTMDGAMMSDTFSGGRIFNSVGTAGGQYVPIELEEFNTEEYNDITRNDFKKVSMSPLSTFALDVDTGSYPNFRRMMNDGAMIDEIPSGAIRTEEMLNYFEFDFENDVEGDMFDVEYEINDCPWNTDNKIIALTVGTKEVEEVPPRNFVILFDTSGSMDDNDKGYLALNGLYEFFQKLNDEDTISIVTYAGDQETIVEGVNNPRKLKAALDKVSRRLHVGGGTNGSGGIIAAYELANKYFIEGGNNRVILFSDGDMNLGVTSQSELVDLVEENAKESNVFLTTLGFGSGNYSDANMEQIANKGNGNYYYIDSLAEAQRVLCDRLNQSTLTVAKDVKIQVEFNPLHVSEYKLLGYENRALADEDFENDEKDGGETGPGQKVTVLYEIKPSGGAVSGNNLKYQQETELTDDDKLNSEIMTLNIRYKEPEGDISTLESFPIVLKESSTASNDFLFACGIAQLVEAIDGCDSTDAIAEACTLLEQGSNDIGERNELMSLLELWRE